jgi:hypothetical protein
MKYEGWTKSGTAENGGISTAWCVSKDTGFRIDCTSKLCKPDLWRKARYLRLITRFKKKESYSECTAYSPCAEVVVCTVPRRPTLSRHTFTDVSVRETISLSRSGQWSKYSPRKFIFGHPNLHSSL